MDQRYSDGAGVDEIEAEVARARHSFHEGLREATRAGSRAARRFVTPAMIGLGLAGGALLVLALVRLARRPASDAALIRIVVETPRSPKRLLPAVGGAALRWVFERQLQSGSPLALLAGALREPRASSASVMPPFGVASETSRERARFGRSL